MSVFYTIQRHYDNQAFGWFAHLLFSFHTVMPDDTIVDYQIAEKKN